ncbi:MAG: hypothetical protein WCP59_16060 [Actinomycetota bacterium]|jgi:hypothetical protein
MRAGRLLVLAASASVMTGLVACSGNDSVPSLPVDSTVALLSTECPAAADQPLAVDQIAPAIAAVEAELGGSQEYFEVNAADVVVNLFVADTAADGSSTVTPYAFSRGELTAQPASPADGNRFTADAVQIDPQRVLSCLVEQLPSSMLTAFVVEGGPNGVVRYSVVAASEQGGQLVVEVSGSGQVLSVDPV